MYIIIRHCHKFCNGIRDMDLQIRVIQRELSGDYQFGIWGRLKFWSDHCAPVMAYSGCLCLITGTQILNHSSNTFTAVTHGFIFSCWFPPIIRMIYPSCITRRNRECFHFPSQIYENLTRLLSEEFARAMSLQFQFVFTWYCHVKLPECLWTEVHLWEECNWFNSCRGEAVPPGS